MSCLSGFEGDEMGLDLVGMYLLWNSNYRQYLFLYNKLLFVYILYIYILVSID